MEENKNIEAQGTGERAISHTASGMLSVIGACALILSAVAFILSPEFFTEYESSGGWFCVGAGLGLVVFGALLCGLSKIVRAAEFYLASINDNKAFVNE